MDPLQSRKLLFLLVFMSQGVEVLELLVTQKTDLSIDWPLLVSFHFCRFQMNKRFLLCFSFFKDLSNQNIKKRLQTKPPNIVEKRVYSLNSQQPKGMKRVFGRKTIFKETI